MESMRMGKQQDKCHKRHRRIEARWQRNGACKRMHAQTCFATAHVQGHPINIGGLNVQGVMTQEYNGIIQGIVLGVKELGSKGVKTMVLGLFWRRETGVQTIVMETWELWEHGESVAGRDSQILLSSTSL